MSHRTTSKATRCNWDVRDAQLRSDLLTWYLGNLSAFWGWGGCDRVMDLKLSSRKLRVGLVQGLAKSLENSRSMRRTEWGQRDPELIFGRFEIGGILEGSLNKSTSLILHPFVVRPDQLQQITLNVVGNHLEHVGEVLAFCG